MTENVSAAAGHPTFQQSYLLTRSIERRGDAALFPSLFGVDNISKDSQSFSISSLSPPMPQWSFVGTNFTFCHPNFSGYIWVPQVCHGCLAYLFSKRQVVIYFYLKEIQKERHSCVNVCESVCTYTPWERSPSDQSTPHNVFNSLGWAKLKLGAWYSILVSHMGIRDSSTWTTTSCLLGCTLVGSCNQEWSWNLNPDNPTWVDTWSGILSPAPKPALG